MDSSLQALQTNGKLFSNFRVIFRIDKKNLKLIGSGVGLNLCFFFFFFYLFFFAEMPLLHFGGKPITV